jgi:hypothetical protein
MSWACISTRPGQAECHTHDHERNGTTCLFAALEVGTGQVTTDHRVRHTGADFLAFMKRVARAYPEAELHVVLDNVSYYIVVQPGQKLAMSYDEGVVKAIPA